MFDLPNTLRKKRLAALVPLVSFKRFKDRDNAMARRLSKERAYRSQRQSLR